MPGSYFASGNPLITQVHNFICGSTDPPEIGWVSFSPVYDAAPDPYNFVKGAKSPVKIIPVALSMAHDADNTDLVSTYKFEVRCRNDNSGSLSISTSNTTVKGTFEISNLAKNESKHVTITDGGVIDKNTLWGLYLAERTFTGVSTNVNEFTIKVYFTQT